MPLFLVKTAKREIFPLDRLLDFVVKVDPKKKPTTQPPVLSLPAIWAYTVPLHIPSPLRDVLRGPPLQKVYVTRPQGDVAKPNSKCALCDKEGQTANYRRCSALKENRKPRNPPTSPGKSTSVPGDIEQLQGTIMECLTKMSTLLKTPNHRKG